MGTAHASSAVTVAITAINGGGRSNTKTGCPAGSPDGQRTAHSDGPARRAEGDIPRRHPQLLGAKSSGKAGFIPGYTTSIWLQAFKQGTYRGQCAEFCGMQRAHMAIEVVAQSDRDFEGWLEAMRQPGRDPPETETEAIRGREVFMRARCAGCHAIRGTDASAHVAPDLTHIASRTTLGAEPCEHNREHGRVDPRSASREARQSDAAQSSGGDNLRGLVAYLGTLR